MANIPISGTTIDNLPSATGVNDTDATIISRDGKTYKSTAMAEQINELSADLTDLDILGGSGISIPDNADLNDYITAGKYYFSGTLGSVTNAPATNRFTLFNIVARGNSLFMFQIWIAATNTPNIFIRFYSNGTWGSWHQISMSTVSTSSVGDPVIMEDEQP